MHIFTKTIAAIMFTVAVIIVAGCNKSDELNNVSGSFNGHDYVDLRTPTYGEWCELCQYTTFEEVKMNGVKGVCFNGTNGNSIYLPYAGFCVGDEIKEEGISGGYWKSTVWGGAESQMFLYINCSFNMGVEAYGPAYYGRSVRPVHSTER